MLTQAISFVLYTLFNLFILAALVRFWMQALGAPARNPIAQFTMALTDFIVKPLRRVIPGYFRLDFASLVAAWLFEFVLQVLLIAIRGVNPFQSGTLATVLMFVALVALVRLSIYVFIGAIIVQAVLSWVNPHHPVGPFFTALTRPFLKPFQRAVPLVGGVDITPILALILLQLILMLPVAWLEQESMLLLARAAL